MFAEHRVQSIYHTIAFALLGLLLVVSDWAIDPSAIWTALLFRFAIASVLLLSAVVKWQSRKSFGNWLATFVSFAIAECLVIALMAKLNGGVAAGVGQVLFLCGGIVVLTWHYSFKFNGPGCVVLALIPNAAGALLVPAFPHVQYVAVVWPAFALVMLTLLKLRPILVECDRLRVEAESAVLFDPNTGLLNKRGLEHSFQRLVKLGYAKPLQQFLLLIEIDGLAKIKETYGEGVGYLIWRQLGSLIEISFRGRDITANLDDEFVCILVHLSRENAFDIAERFRGLVAEKEFKCSGASDGTLKCTVSIGIVAADTKDKIDSLVNLARVGVNQAKSSGGNQCACL